MSAASTGFAYPQAPQAPVARVEHPAAALFIVVCVVS
jgi:hypothetical protein